MGFLLVSTVFCLTVASSLATYGPDYRSHGPRPHLDGARGRGYGDSPKIHLDSPRIILDKPSINIHQGGSGHLLDEGLVLENESPVYIKQAASPIIIDGGHSAGSLKVLNHAPIAHEQPILIRRPVVVSKALYPTQDNLERIHYASAGIVGHSLGGISAIKAPVVYGGLSEGIGLGHGYGLGQSYSLGHGIGHGYSLGHGIGLGQGYSLGHGIGLGHGLVSGYSAPLIIEQPRAQIIKADIGHGDISYGSGKALGGAIYLGGGYGGSLHGDGLRGGAIIAEKSIPQHGGAILAEKSIHGGSYGGSISGGSLGGAGLKKY